MHICWHDLWDSLFVIQCSAGRRRLRNKLCKTELTEGLCTSWRTKRCDWKKETKQQSLITLSVPKARKQLKFSINIVNFYSHSSMLLLLSVWYSCQVYTHSSNEEVYARFCCPLAVIYMKRTMLVTLLSLKCLIKHWHNTCKSDSKFSAFDNRSVRTSW